MYGSVSMVLEAAMPMAPVVLLVGGALCLWVIGLALHARPSTRPVPAFRLPDRRR